MNLKNTLLPSHLLTIFLVSVLSACASAPVTSVKDSEKVQAKKEDSADPQSKVLVEEILATNSKLQAQDGGSPGSAVVADDDLSDDGELDDGLGDNDTPSMIAGTAGIAGQDKTTTAPSAATPPTVAQKKTPEIPVEINTQVRKWIQYFTVKDRERFARFLARGEKYREVVESILEENGVPSELYYLALIESGFQTSAFSRTAAVGVWQFMRATGSSYGLASNYYVDERRDPIRATEAAAKHLRDLHGNLSSWYLAMAAYNAGEARINGAIRRGKTRDYWSLARRGYLPAETADYVPKFLAAVIIGRNPDVFGFGDIKVDSYPDLEAVAVPTPVKLSDVAKLGSVPLAELEKVNPHLTKGVTPPGLKTYEIWVPQANAQAVEKISTKLASYRVRGLRVRREPSIDLSRLAHTTRVRRGETLTIVARRTGLSASYLKRINGLKTNQLQAGMALRISKKNYQRSSLTHYRVKPGDSLATIAKKFGVSVVTIKKTNRIHRNRIYTGQTLRIVSNT